MINDEKLFFSSVAVRSSNHIYYHKDFLFINTGGIKEREFPSKIKSWEFSSLCCVALCCIREVSIKGRVCVYHHKKKLFENRLLQG